MPTITVKNIPPDLYELLKSSAQAHRRSINSEVITCLETTLRSRRVDPDAFLARIDALQKRTDLPPLTDEILERGKEFGRK
jgi:plasmid stability protein